jgi:hypothetical protein
MCDYIGNWQTYLDGEFEYIIVVKMQGTLVRQSVWETRTWEISSQHAYKDPYTFWRPLNT